MARGLSRAIRGALAGATVVIAGLAVTADAVMAQEQGQRVIRGERYVPGISITPDGCEVWVMDDGAEGYADTRLTRDGRPVCHDVNQCGLVNTDQFFATDSYRIHSGGKQRLAEFFRQSSAFGFIIVGHTDSRASDPYNMRLSYNRANSVASVANSIGARVLDVRGYGERMPVATNATRDGMARNRRVEILCVN